MKHTKVFSILLSGLFILLSACQKEPTAAFTASKLFALPDEPIIFTNLATDADHYDWSFDDGTRSNEKNPIHSFSNKGEYLVTLYAFSKNGQKSNLVSQKITIGSTPACNFTYSPRFPKPGESVHFIDNSANSPTSWLWDFGDGTTSTEKNPNHLFTAEKKYDLTLTVTNDYASYKQTDSIFVLNQTPVMPSANYNFTLNEDLTVNFLDQSTGNPTAWLWNFGDGASSSLQNPCHTYSQAGYFYVVLRVFNLAGSHQLTQMVNISSILPIANFIYSEGDDHTIYFQDKSTGNPRSWEWNFGDGATSTLQNPSHQYSQIGSYNVTLKVTNLAGSNQITQLIYVSNNQFLFIAGTYNVVDEGTGGTSSYVDQISASIELTNKFYIARFGNFENGSVYFSVSGNSITIPSQTVHCGTPPNDVDHTFNGSGFFTYIGENLTIFLEYTDRSTLGVFKRTGRYTKL